MSLLRQGSAYLIIGVLQLLLDWAVFVLVTAAGLPVVQGNLAGRVAGMLLGFWLNGRITFATADGEQRLGWRRFARFLPLWLLLTTASTLLVSSADHALGLQYAWLAKPLVEGGLAVISFLLLRHEVYR
ncbi:GtrA family protein [Stenotrophomonas geniculata]|jgi:putative flippase GtrA|uniref:GtrA family protein n=1 Tax=Stenotrophomonas geniculata TaxID=86188 RepID=A0ABW1N054_9GAMM|nr:GtrA family protein [Stenotrophomonas geniculata]MCI1068095.1 GtrA family protein [Stenotrophomonas maltophilia]MCI1091142.1 GtrA family protein [Stenotrophomonas maltophilia]MCI1109215.1 GtrA family protein [Stenotrophomonas maltophilia]MCI1127301.1 GtrA family protein [Stenotrophomonas maltophilia]MCU1018503.1 GtrA family protein [Stenotrophomonas maltophilia]